MLQQNNGLTKKILFSMLLGLTIGVVINHLPSSWGLQGYLVDSLLDLGGKIFITILKMLVVPIVLLSLIGGTCNLSDNSRLGWLAIKTISLYIFTTALAISIALLIASLVGVGSGAELHAATTFNIEPAPSLKQTILRLFPGNPFAALASGEMLQVIVFAIFLGMAINMAGEAGERVKQFFQDFDVVVMKLMQIVINTAPYGIFCLVATIFARSGFSLIERLLGYFLTVSVVLLIQLVVTYPLLLQMFARLNPITLLKKFAPAIMFAFSTSSSSASIPVVLNTVETRLGVSNNIAAFVIPLGATINMDGTAIMQGVATVFIANAYGIPLTMTALTKVILTATLASIGTAGVPSVGLITLTMVLQQAGLPIEGVALIIGVDRILDMIRTAVNVTGDATVACIVAKSEKAIDVEQFNRPVESV